MSNFSKISKQVLRDLANPRYAAVDKEADRQRVNSYIADVLKDAHVLYAKLARLHGDFGGTELKELEKVSEVVLSIGGKLASFSKAFNEGKAKMNEPDVYGEAGSSGGGDLGFGGASSQPPSDFSSMTGDMFGEESSGESAGGANSQPPEQSADDDAEPIDIEFDFEDEPSDEDEEAAKKPPKKPAKKDKD